MGVNAQTSVPAFTAGQVLTAAQMTEVNTGIPVFATTVTRDAAFGGAGEKVLAQGQYAYIEATSTLQVYTGSAWQAVGGGLTLVKSQTIGTAVATIDITDCFSATYDQYLVSWRTTPSTTLAIRAQFLTSVPAAITTGYYYAGYYSQFTSSTLNGVNQNNGSSYQVGNISAGAQGAGQFTLLNPFVTDISYMTTQFTDAGNPYQYSGYNSSILALPSLRLNTSTGTITGGYVKVYGYQL